MARRPAKIWTGTDWDDIGDASKVLKTGDTITGPTVVDVNSSSAALRVTQTGAGNAFVVEDSANPDSTPFVIKDTGATSISNLLTVSTQNYTPASIGFDPYVVVAGDANQNAFRADGFSGSVSRIVLNTSKGSFGSQGVVASGDTVGEIRFTGSDGTGFIRAATIQGAVDGTPGTNDMPGRLVFSTTADGASTPTERMRITNSGNVGIGTGSPGANLHIESDTAGNQFLARNSSDTTAPTHTFLKARGTAASRAIVAANDTVGAINFNAHDGSAYQQLASIRAIVDATPGAGDTPGRLVFYTTADGSATLTERMRINNAGLITGSGTSLGAWTAYTPTLGGTGWAIGDGTRDFAYAQVGKLVLFRGRLVFGSTSTFGAVAPQLSLPLTAKTGTIFTSVPALGARFVDVSLGSNYAGAVINIDASTVAIHAYGADGLLPAVTSTVPFTWAVSDVIDVSGFYEAA